MPDFDAGLLYHGTLCVVHADLLFGRGQHLSLKIKNTGARAAGANVDADDVTPITRYLAGLQNMAHRNIGGCGDQRSTLLGRMTKSRMVMLRGRVSMNKTASATSLGIMSEPLAKASYILARGQSSNRAVTTGPGNTAPIRMPCCDTCRRVVCMKACTANLDAV